MIRTVITPVNTDLHIAIPSHYVGKQIEVLLYTTDEPQQFPISDINLEQYNKEIDEAMMRIDNGHFTSHDDLKKEMDTW